MPYFPITYHATNVVRVLHCLEETVFDNMESALGGAQPGNRFVSFESCWP